MNKYCSLLVVVLLLLSMSGCGPGPATTAVPASASLTLSSAAFAHGEAIPDKYTCTGEDRSPPLAWGDPPPGTASFALILDDPDADGFVHWVVYDLPEETRSLPENADVQLPGGAKLGENDFGEIAHGGPCPPSGQHRYVFSLYALDTALNLKEGASKAEVIQAASGHILGQAELVGTYRKP